MVFGVYMEARFGVLLFLMKCAPSLILVKQKWECFFGRRFTFLMEKHHLIAIQFNWPYLSDVKSEILELNFYLFSQLLIIKFRLETILKVWKYYIY